MKTHMSFGTTDLDASVAFYRTLLNSEPVKRYPDYALFVLDDPGLELALSPDARAHELQRNHYGLAVESPELVAGAIERLTRAGLQVEVERGETCCYATQDKVWATDPDGRRWETYHVIAESEERESANLSCCGAASGENTCCPA